jgi:hypothetical protein
MLRQKLNYRRICLSGIVNKTHMKKITYMVFARDDDGYACTLKETRLPEKIICWH